MQLICVPPHQAARVWPHVRELILAAMRRGDLSAFAPVEAGVLAGDALLWLAVVGRGDADPDIAGASAPAHPGYTIAAAAVTEIAETEWRKVCVVVACGGTAMDRWLPLLDGIETYARAAGCAAVRIVGRKGWARVLGQYKTKRIILEKEL